jgi:hypothetical protein
LLVQAAAKVAERIRKDMPPPALLRFFPESPLRPADSFMSKEADSFMSKENEGMSEARSHNWRGILMTSAARRDMQEL